MVKRISALKLAEAMAVNKSARLFDTNGWEILS